MCPWFKAFKQKKSYQNPLIFEEVMSFLSNIDSIERKSQYFWLILRRLNFSLFLPSKLAKLETCRKTPINNFYKNHLKRRNFFKNWPISKISNSNHIYMPREIFWCKKIRFWLKNVVRRWILRFQPIFLLFLDYHLPQPP